MFLEIPRNCVVKEYHYDIHKYSNGALGAILLTNILLGHVHVVPYMGASYCRYWEVHPIFLIDLAFQKYTFSGPTYMNFLGGAYNLFKKFMKQFSSVDPQTILFKCGSHRKHFSTFYHIKSSFQIKT